MRKHQRAQYSFLSVSGYAGDIARLALSDCRVEDLNPFGYGDEEIKTHKQTNPSISVNRGTLNGSAIPISLRLEGFLIWSTFFFRFH
jgi:hypothetical protein